MICLGNKCSRVLFIKDLLHSLYLHGSLQCLKLSLIEVGLLDRELLLGGAYDEI